MITKDTPSSPTARRLKWLIPVTVVLMAVLIGGGMFVTRRWNTYQDYMARIRPGVTIAGLDVGGMTPDEARALVGEKWVEPLSQPIELRYLDHSQKLDPATVGFTVLVDAMVDEAAAIGADTSFRDFLTPPWVPLRKQGGAPFDVDVSLQTDFDRELLTDFVDSLAEDVDRPVREHHLNADELTFYPGQAGFELDRHEAVEIIVPALSPPLGPPPQAGGEVRTVTLPVTILEVTPLDEAELRSKLEDIATEVDRPVQKHRLSKEDLTFYPGQAGVELDRDEAMKRITTALSPPPPSPPASRGGGAPRQAANGCPPGSPTQRGRPAF